MNNYYLTNKALLHILLLLIFFFKFQVKILFKKSVLYLFIYISNLLVAMNLNILNLSVTYIIVWVRQKIKYLFINIIPMNR